MERLASKMANAYCDNGFWIDLPIIAEHVEIPTKFENWSKDELIEKIQDVIGEYGSFSTGEIAADHSPCIYSGAGVTILAERFYDDSVSVISYNDDGNEITDEDMSYESLDEECLRDIYELCLVWVEEND